MPDLQIINDDSDLRKYRIELPNIIDDLGLTPYEGRLYLHYKRVCGANGGTCIEGTRGTARRTKMSVGQVSKARDSLADKGLIEKIESGQYTHVKIVDIWEINFTYFLIKDRPDIAGWTIQRLKDYLKSVHTVNTSIVKCSPDEHSVHTVNTLDQKCSYSETKKELINKNQPIRSESRANKILSLPEHKELALKLTQICGYAGPEYVVNGKLNDCAAAVQKLASWGVTVDLLDKFKSYWWGDNPPTFNQVVEEWGKFLGSLDQSGQPAQPGDRYSPPAIDEARRAAYAALRAESEAVAAETAQRVKGVMTGGIKAAGVDVGRAVKAQVRR